MRYVRLMKLIEVSVGKEIKVGLPNFSNITARCDLKFQMIDREDPDWDAIWDQVNQQLAIQSNSIDPSWITTKSYKNFFKTTIKATKGA